MLDERCFVNHEYHEQYLNERIEANKNLIDVHIELRSRNMDSIRDKHIIYTILQICMEDQFINTDLATKIIGFVKEARMES